MAKKEQEPKKILLPIKGNPYSDVNTNDQYVLMGIQIFPQRNDLFVEVILPDGWKKQSTDHPLWEEVVDDQGRKRMSIFHKSVEYDRDAFVNFERRYGKRVGKGAHDWSVVDNATGEVIFADQPIDVCERFLEEEFPNHININAYW